MDIVERLTDTNRIARQAILPKPDPDVEVVRAIITAWHEGTWSWLQDPTHEDGFSSALAAYKANKP